MGVDFRGKRMFHPFYSHPIELNANFEGIIMKNFKLADKKDLFQLKITLIRIENVATFKNYMMKLE